MSVVLDASAAVDLVLGRPELTPLLGGQDIHVPAHFDVEVVGALRGLWWRRVIDEPTAERARADLARLAVVRYPAPALVDRAWDWRHDITIPDGAYVALAEILACPLLTTDERLARVAQRHVDVLAPRLPPPGPARQSGAVASTCSHLDTIRDVAPSDDGCHECLQTGDRWLHLRMCEACGHIGCCDSSPNRHATAHVRSTGHALVRSFEPGEDWFYCYPDDLLFALPAAGPAPSHS